MHRSVVIALLFWSQLLVAQPQTYSFRHLDKSDGLLHNVVTGIGQDARGYIWILTLKGLQRYDGSRFVNYPEVVNHTLPAVMDATTLLIDNATDNVSVIKWDSIEQLNLRTNQIKTIMHEDQIMASSDQRQTFFDSDSIQWQMTRNGIFCQTNPSSTNLCHLLNYHRTKPHSDYYVHDAEAGELWINRYRYLLHIDLKANKSFSSARETEHPLLREIHETYGSDGLLRYVMKDSDDNIWVTTWRPVFYKYDEESKQVQTYSLTDALQRHHPEVYVDSTILINAIFEDRQNQIWLITDKAGLVKYDKSRDDFEFILSQPNNPDGLHYNFVIRSIFQDRENNIWLGTDKGISIFNPYHSRITPIRPVSQDKNAPTKYEITDVLATSEGPILISTWGGGIYVYDQEWNFIRTMRFEGFLNYNLVWCFVEANDGTIWMGAQHGHVHLYNPGNGQVRTIQPPETLGSTIRVMTKDRDGNILLGLQNGRIVIWNAALDTFLPYDEGAHSPPILFSPITNLFIDAKNNCWVGTDYGLRHFDRSKRMITATYLPDPTYVKQNSTQMIQGIQDYNDTTLVLGTIDGGLYLFNTNDHTFSQKSLPPSLAHSSIHAVRKDDSGDIWITTDYGLFTFDPLIQKSRQYRFEQDMITSAFVSCRFYPLPGDKWMTATSTEVVYFHPDDMNDVNIVANTVEITGTHVFGEPLFIDSLRRQGLPIRLPFDQNFLTISYSLLDFSQFQQTQYMHRLSGVDKNWVVTTTEQQAEYTDLKPGEYLFEVRAQSGDQVTDITTQSIIIMPPWYGTWWFRLLVLGVLLGTLIGLFWYRIASIRKQGQLRQQITEMEMMALRAQMNPHFIFNCINSIDAMIQSNDKYRATTYLNKFAKLIRNILDSSSHHKVPLSKDVETLRLYVELEQFRHENKFTAKIDADEMLLQGEYKVPPLIIQPYVENAILHGLRHRPGNSGKLQVSISKVEEHLLFCIEDNGVGRKTNGERSTRMNGMGLQLSSNRIRLFNDEDIASVEIIDLEEHGNPCGTRVNVRLNLR